MNGGAAAGAPSSEADVAQLPDLRMFVVALVAWVTAWVAVGTPDASPTIALLAAAAMVCGLVVLAANRRLPRKPASHWRRDWFALASVAAAASMLVAAMVAVRAPARTPQLLIDAAESQTERGYTLVITGAGKPAAGAQFGPPSLRYRAQIQHVEVRPEPNLTSKETHDAQTPLDGVPVVVTLPVARANIGPSSDVRDSQMPGSADASEALAIGTTVQVRAKVRLTDPGDSAVAMLYAKGEVQLRAPPHPLLQMAHDVRTQTAAVAAMLPAPGNMLIPGLAAGDEQLVSDDLNHDMKATSLTHLTAVSGSNIAVIVAGVLLLGRWVGFGRVWRLVLALPVLAAFVCLVTPQGSVIRATAMAVIVIGIDLAGRKVAGVPVLSLAVLGLLVADPWLSRDYGFALSAAATAGLLLGTRPLANLLQRWLPQSVALLIAVPTVAQVACQPILLLLEPSLPTYGVLANLLAAPAAPIATLAGLLLVAAVVVAPALAPIVAWLAWLPAQWIGLVAEAFAAFPAANLPWPGGLPGALLWIATITAIVIACSPRSLPPWLHGQPSGLQQRAWCLLQRIASGLVVTAAIVVSVIWVGRMAVRMRDFPHDWRLVACDVGQGDALLLRGGSLTMLVDTGLEPEPVARCLRDFGIREIDVLVLTHFDADHAGAADALPVPVRSLWVPDTEDARTEPLVQRFHRAQIPVTHVATDDRVTIGDLEITVLWPRRATDGSPSSLADNDGSVILRADPTADCQTGCVSSLLLGDSGEAVQQQLDPATLPADIVKVAHHGSRDQFADAYGYARAQLAVISVGADNGYGHPTQSTLTVLANAQTPWLRTDEHGDIAVFADRRQHTVPQVWTSRNN